MVYASAARWFWVLGPAGSLGIAVPELVAAGV